MEVVNYLLSATPIKDFPLLALLQFLSFERPSCFNCDFKPLSLHTNFLGSHGPGGWSLGICGFAALDSVAVGS